MLVDIIFNNQIFVPTFGSICHIKQYVILNRFFWSCRPLFNVRSFTRMRTTVGSWRSPWMALQKLNFKKGQERRMRYNTMELINIAKIVFRTECNKNWAVDGTYDIHRHNHQHSHHQFGSRNKVNTQEQLEERQQRDRCRRKKRKEYPIQ